MHTHAHTHAAPCPHRRLEEGKGLHSRPPPTLPRGRRLQNHQPEPRPVELGPIFPQQKAKRARPQHNKRPESRGGGGGIT